MAILWQPIVVGILAILIVSLIGVTIYYSRRQHVCNCPNCPGPPICPLCPPVNGGDYYIYYNNKDSYVLTFTNRLVIESNKEYAEQQWRLSDRGDSRTIIQSVANGQYVKVNMKDAILVPNIQNATIFTLGRNKDSLPISLSSVDKSLSMDADSNNNVFGNRYDVSHTPWMLVPTLIYTPPSS